MCLPCNHAERTITPHQDKYIETMLERYVMKDFLPFKTPMIPNTHLVPATSEGIAKFEVTGETIDGMLGYSTI